MTLPDFQPPSVAKAANPAKAGSQISNFSDFSSARKPENDLPLAAKLRALGQPIGLEVDGVVVAWIVADDEAARRPDVCPVFTAAEAAVLAKFDKKGMHDLISLKARFGGKLTRDEGD